MRASKYLSKGKFTNSDTSKFNSEWISAHFLIIIGIFVVFFSFIKLLLTMHEAVNSCNTIFNPNLTIISIFFCLGVVLIIFGKISVIIVENAKSISEILLILKNENINKRNTYNSDS